MAGRFSQAAGDTLVADLAAVPPACGRLLRLSERDPRRAVKLARQGYACVAAEDRLKTAWATFTLGYALLRRELASEALPWLEEALQRFEDLRLTVPSLHARRTRLAALLLLGQGVDLQQHWDDLCAAYLALGRERDACRARFDQIGHLNLLGHGRAALAMIEQIQPVVQQVGAAQDQARLARLSAVAYRLLGQLDQAQAAIEAAIMGYDRVGAVPDLAKSLFERLVIHERRDDFVAALADLQQAQSIFRRLQMPLWQAYLAMDGGLIASRQGRYDVAVAMTCQARSLLEQLQRWDHVASCDLNLANIAFYSGLFELALAVYRRAEHQFHSMDRLYMALICRRNQALALQALDQPAAALEILQALPLAAARLGDHAELAEVQLAQALVLHELGQPDAARTGLVVAERLFSELGNTPMMAVCRLEQGWLALDCGDLTVAVDLLHSVGDQLGDQPFYAWRVRYGLGLCLDRQGQPAAAGEYFRAAGTILSWLRRRLSSEHASSGIFRQSAQFIVDALGLARRLDAPELALELLEGLHGVVLDSRVRRNSFVIPPNLQQEFAARQSELRLLVEQLAEQSVIDATIERYVELLLRAHHLHPVAETLPTTTFDLRLVRERCTAAFPAGWSILAYVQPDADSLLVIMIDAEHATLQTVPLDRQLRKALRYATSPESLEYTFLDLPYLNGTAARPWETLSRIGSALIPAEVQMRLHPDYRLLIIPGGLLQHLAWPALRLDNAWLVERAVVQLLPSLQVWLTLLDREPTSAEALLLGVSSFDGRAPALPNALPSLDLVERIWPQPVTRVTDQQLTPAWLLERAADGELGKHGLIHIATHGQLLAARGLLAHLKLSTDYLFYDDVARLQLAGALVVLAACEGASGEVLPGEEVISLSRAFLAGGARDVIASSWPIYDNGVLGLLQPLYNGLVAGRDAPSALALAQRALISQWRNRLDGTTVLGSPLIWAGFTALGAGTAARWQRVVPAPLPNAS